MSPLATLLLFLSLASPARDLGAAHDHYRAGRYGEALAAYESVLAHAKDPDARVLYDAGNCAYRLQRFPEAALYYRRALRRAPRDPHARFNLLLTERKLGMAGTAEDGFVASLARAADSMPAADLLWIGAALETAALALLVAARRRRGAAIAGIALLAAAAGAGTIVARKVWFPPSPQVLVMATEVKVYSEPRDDLPAILKVPVGEVLALEEASDRWVKVRHRDRVGWTPRAGVGIVD